jgi:cytochrome P450
MASSSADESGLQSGGRGFDPFTPEALRDPYPLYARFRAADPVHWSEKLRAWVLFRSDDVVRALKDDERLSADRSRASRGAPARRPAGGPRVRTVAIDPPDVVPVRAMLTSTLGPKVRAMRPGIDDIVRRLLERIAEATAHVTEGLPHAESLDLVHDYAYPLPIRVIAELLGVPERDHDRFQMWSHAVARGMDRFFSSDQVMRGLKAIDGYVRTLVERARAVHGDDLIHRLLGAEYRGDTLSTEEVVALCTALVFGGHETTVNLIANGMLALLERPETRDALAEDPALDATAIEELLRFDSPAQLIARTVTVDFEWRAKQLRAGDTVLIGLGAANRDPEVFSDPEVLDLRRDPNPHVAFGLGTHVCPGAQLSRFEGRAAIPALLRRFPTMALAEAPTRRPTAVLRGLERLPVRITPA